jgi:hypothetical protein
MSWPHMALPAYMSYVMFTRVAAAMGRRKRRLM